MIEKYHYVVPEFTRDEPKELKLLSIIYQSFFQPFSLEDNLLVILTALTSGSGVGFNRAMLFRAEGDKLKGEIWLGPRSTEEANSIWEVLSTPGMGYIEIIEYNRSLLSKKADTLTNRIKPIVYALDQENLPLPALAARQKEIMMVRDANHEPLVDKNFLDLIKVNEFLCIPLLAQDELLGEIVVDNAITRFPIEAKDIKLASICGLIAGNYIYTSSLHKKMVEMEKLAALGEMAMFITHQLRNPLATMGGFTDQILHSPLDENRQRRNLEIIRKEIKRLEDVLFKLTHFLKVDIKQAVPLELQPLLQTVLHSSEIQTKSQGISIQVDIKEGIPRILCDPTYLGEALRNLLDNALDATPKGGAIFIQAYRENKNFLVVSIRDTGKGMSESIMQKLFVPFFSTKDKGLGLGLLYVKRVMDSCGGKMEVESEEGKGTVFKLYFKCQD